MDQQIPAKARCVIIGGGVAGCSLAYHLAKLGWRDVVLLERKQLTCGTTWHAAGLIGQGRTSPTYQKLSMYSADLYEALEAETGVATGMKRNGSLLFAITDERAEEVRRLASSVRMNGLDAHILGPSEARELYPLLRIDDVKVAMHIPRDGQADPANVALALAKGARQQGVEVIEGVAVTAIHRDKGRVTGVSTSSGDIAADYVVNCAGMWGRDVGLMAGVDVPLQACEHYYIVTEPIEGLPRDLPTLRAQDEAAYYKEDAGKLLVGGFELVAKPWALDGIPDDFCFDQLPEDVDHFEPILEMAIKRVPILETAGIHTFFCGPESFTPDDRWLMGEAPGLANFYMLCGYNSIGIISSGGAGKALAEWMDGGEMPFDLGDVDIARIQGFQNNQRYLTARVTETLGLLYADHFPYRQFASARGIRRSPLHHEMAALGACFGEVAGWERPNWFLPPSERAAGKTPKYDYSWGRQNWFEYARAEHMAIREGVGFFDMTSFGKIRVEGPDAEDVLQRVCANDVAVPPGRIVYTQWLNRHGGVEADLTVTRLTETAFLVITPATSVVKDMAWLARLTPEDARVVATNVTATECVIPVMGPGARELLAKLTPADLSNEAFPFARAREIDFAMARVRAHRITYVGELGWELYVSSDMAAHVFGALWEAGEPMGLRPCGLHVLDSCRMEKAFRHMGHDISCEDHVLEAGLGFAVKPDKKRSKFGEFISRDAVLERREKGLTRRLVQFRLEDPEPLLYHYEPIYRDGNLAGYVTSGNYGHYLGAAVALGYVDCEPGETAGELTASSYQIEVGGKRFSALASLRPMYDPKAARVRG